MMPAKPVVYLVHFNQPYLHAGHYLGVASNETEINAERPGNDALTLHAADGVVADVWEADSIAEAQELLEKFQRQGSRRRLCSICSPKNARGAGRGNWIRRPGVAAWWLLAAVVTSGACLSGCGRGGGLTMPDDVIVAPGGVQPGEDGGLPAAPVVPVCTDVYHPPTTVYLGGGVFVRRPGWVETVCMRQTPESE